jgi:hypothetical protein
MSNNQANNIKQQIEQTMSGITGLLKVANDKLKEAQESAQTIDEKKEFVTAFMQSGVLKEFQDVNNKLEELNKWQS